MFNIPESQTIDQQILQRKYMLLQEHYHPDLAFNHDREAQKDLQDHSSDVSKAYSTLKNPLSRAMHLFEVKCNIEYETASQERKTQPNLLKKIIEIDMQIDEAGEKCSLLRKLQQKCEIESEMMKANFEESLLDQKCSQALDYLIQWNFYNKRKDVICDKLFELQ